MKSKNFAKTIIILSMLTACAGGANQQYPKDADQNRMEKRSGAYDKAAGQSLNKQGVKGQDCYYRMSGCSDEIKNQPTGQAANTYNAPSTFPKDGYMLEADGLYHYKPGAMSRSK
jgi:hypothetical protein